jgi:hypothetical protein
MDGPTEGALMLRTLLNHWLWDIASRRWSYIMALVTLPLAVLDVGLLTVRWEERAGVMVMLLSAALVAPVALELVARRERFMLWREAARRRGGR